MKRSPSQAGPIRLVRIPRRLMRPDLQRRLPASNQFDDITGRTVGSCTVIGLAGFLHQYSVWLCRCQCGRLFLRRAIGLKHRSPKYCDCSNRHRVAGTVEYGIWFQLLKRHRTEPCVCQRWTNYLDFRRDVGRRPRAGLSLVRIDSERPFEPGNFRWVPTPHARRGEYTAISHAGLSLNMSQWADRIGISRERMRQRIAKCKRCSVDLSLAITTPAGHTMPLPSARPAWMTPGIARTIEYRNWKFLRSSYPAEVFPGWSEFDVFLRDVGHCPGKGLKLGRIDWQRPYEPGNAQWVPRREARRTTRIAAGGESLTIAQWAEQLGLSVQRLRYRIQECHRRGIDVAKFLVSSQATGGLTPGKAIRRSKKSSR
jgi:hypothetical protein